MTDLTPRALIVGCGDIAMASSRLIGEAHPLLMIDIDRRRLDAASATLQAEGFAVSSFVADITSETSVTELAFFLQGGPALQVIAHVAALAPSVGDWRKLMEVNLIGPHLIAKHIAPLLVERGVTVFVGSVAAYFGDLSSELRAVLSEPLAAGFFERLEAASPLPVTASQAYFYSKGALIEYCEVLASEWGPRRVRCVSVSLGLIQSAMGARERAHNPNTGSFVALTPLGREGMVAEAAAAIGFAASEQASFINGVDILVDGGLRASMRVSQRAKS